MKKKNTINTYGYITMKSKHHLPLHIVVINHCMLASFRVFTNSKSALNYIEREKDDLEEYGKLVYNTDFDFSEYKGLIKDFVNARMWIIDDDCRMYIKY